MKYGLIGLIVAFASPAFAADPIPGCVGRVCGIAVFQTQTLSTAASATSNGFTITSSANATSGTIQSSVFIIQKKIDVSSPIF